MFSGGLDSYDHVLVNVVALACAIVVDAVTVKLRGENIERAAYLSSLWSRITAELHSDAAHWLTPDRDVEEATHTAIVRRAQRRRRRRSGGSPCRPRTR